MRNRCPVRNRFVWWYGCTFAARTCPAYLISAQFFPFSGLSGLIRNFALLTLVAGLQVGAADPRIGIWTLISAQSSLDPPNKLSITSVHDPVHVVISGETHLDFTAKWDGHDAPLPGNPGFNQVRLRRIDKKQVEPRRRMELSQRRFATSFRAMGTS